jgi:hypothetical protein
VKKYSISFNDDRWMDKSGAVHEADTSASLTAVFKNGLSIGNLGPSVGPLRSYDIPMDVTAGPGTGVAVGSW